MKYDNVFIIGIQRAATTSLAHLMMYNDAILSCVHVRPYALSLNALKTAMVNNKTKWVKRNPGEYYNPVLVDYLKNKATQTNFPIMCLKNDGGDSDFVTRFSKICTHKKPLLIFCIRDSFFELYCAWTRWKKQSVIEEFGDRAIVNFKCMDKIFKLAENDKVDLCFFSFFADKETIMNRAKQLMDIMDLSLSAEQEMFLNLNPKVAGAVPFDNHDLIAEYHDIPKVEELASKYNSMINYLDKGLINEK